MTLTLSLWDRAPYIFIDPPPGEELDDLIIDTLDKELRFEVPDAEYTDAWKNNEWDGYHRLLKISKNGNYYFPFGLLPRVREVLDSLGIDYEVEGVTVPGQGDLGLGWNTDMTLRDYQQEAADEALSRGNGIVVLPTGAGKTLIGLYLAHRIDRPTIVVTHNKEIADQWVEKIESVLGVEPARYYGGDRENGDVMVGLYQSIYEDGEVRDDVRLDHDVALFDEVHRVGAQTFSRVAFSITAPYRFGMSATPDREDNATLRVIGGSGPIIADLSAERLIDEGYLAKPNWIIKEAPSAGGRYPNWQEEYKNEVVENHRRNKVVAQTVADLDKPCLVTVERINHGERLEALIDDEFGGTVTFVSGDSSHRDETIQAFRDGDLDVLVATRGIVGEGFDVQDIRSFVVAGGLKSSTSMIQQVGRALRPGETGEAQIVDFLDSGQWIAKHTEQRIRTYQEYYGEYGP